MWVENKNDYQDKSRQSLLRCISEDETCCVPVALFTSSNLFSTDILPLTGHKSKFRNRAQFALWVMTVTVIAGYLNALTDVQLFYKSLAWFNN